MAAIIDKQKKSSVTKGKEGKSNEVHAIQGLDLTVRKGT